MKKIILLFLAAITVSQLFSQESVERVLRDIEKNNITLKKLREQKELAQAENRTSTYLADPEVEFGYMWGIAGGKKNVSVKQSFDFPSLYSSKRAVQVQKSTSLEYLYKAERMELMLSAKKLCLELIYYNALTSLYFRQFNNARQILAAHKKMLDEGQTNILEYNKSQMNLANIEAELFAVEAERVKVRANLETMNGGEYVFLDDTVYSAPVLFSDFEQWFSNVKQENPALAYLESRVSEAEKNIVVRRRATLPRFSVGFAGEYLKTEKLSGLTIGITIPLWENRGKVSMAKLEVAQIKKELQDARWQYYLSLKAKYTKAVGLEQVVSDYRKFFVNSRADELLYKAYRGGELSLLNYLLEMEYFCSAYSRCLQAEKELAIAVAELEAFKL